MGSQERRQRERDQRRGQILDAARGILLSRGMAAVSMSQIAAAAELSVGTLYLYFKNKEELFAALQQEGLDLLEQMLGPVLESADGCAERLERLALIYLEFSEQHRKYFDIINYFVAQPTVLFPSDLKAELDSHGGRVLGAVERVLAHSASRLRSGQAAPSDAQGQPEPALADRPASRRLAGSARLSPRQRRVVWRCALVFWSALQGLLQLRKMQDTLLQGEDFRELYLFGCRRAIEALEAELARAGL